MRDLPHAVVGSAGVLSAVFAFDVADVHVAYHVVLDCHVLTDQEARAVWNWEAVQSPGELGWRVTLKQRHVVNMEGGYITS